MSYWRLALFVFATDCTAVHVVTLPPLQSKHPVSASAAYLDREGTIVGAEDYQVLAPFQFTREDRSSGAHFESTLQLGPELDRQVVTAQGDAVTKLRIQSTSFETHQNVASIVGVSLEVVGAILMIQDLASRRDEDHKLGPVFWTSAACFGTGALLYVVGDLTKPTSWQFQVSGQVVRSRAKADPPAAAVNPY